MINIESARQQMVEQQVRTWDVFDSDVLATIGVVERDRYVPAELQHCAYADVEIPLPHGQCMLRPSIVGRILQALDVQPGDDVLEVGTGTGYLTHCLSRHAASVISIDIHDDFIRAAQARLADADVTNVTLHCMDATAALPEGLFDAIAVTGAIDTLDHRYIAALKPGGRLFVVTGSSPVMTAHLVTVGEDGKAEDRELFETDIPPLVSGPRRPVFSF